MTPDRTVGYHVPASTRLWIILALLVTAAFAGACAGPSAPRPASVVGRVPSRGYLAAFPASDMSEALSRAFQAVKQIQVSVTYDVHSFSEEDAPTRMDLQREDVIGRAVSVEPVSELRVATAVIVSRSPRNLVLLTAAHAVFRPDTVVEYFKSELRGPEGPARRVRSLSIKRAQTNWLLDLPGTQTFELLAWNREEDVALIGCRNLDPEEVDRAGPIPVRAGDPADLAPGSFVYVLGYPGGYRMVSRGVATPLNDRRASFVVDSNWNQGVSGGVVLAVRGDSDTLEWVGIARAAAAKRERRLVPPEAAAEAHDPALPYEGPIFLEETLRIRYGITLSVPMTTIRSFIDRSRELLTSRGYPVPRL